MNPTYKEYVFDFSELKLLSMICLKCKTEIIINTTEMGAVPDACPSCGKRFGGTFIQSVHDFRKAYAYFTDKNADASASIRIRREVNVAEL